LIIRCHLGGYESVRLSDSLHQRVSAHGASCTGSCWTHQSQR
jgi:hypothetical protein